MRRNHLLIIAVGLFSLAAQPFPHTIDLPTGFQGEGIAAGEGSVFYAGSLADGRIARGDLAAGTAEVWVSDPAVIPAVGLWADLSNHLLFVAGGPSGSGAAYDTKTGAAVATLLLTAAPSFINDVVATNDAAYFTNSFSPELYRVPIGPTGTLGSVEVVPLLGPAGQFVAGFNLNGIEATADGKTLIVINSATGQLFTVDAGTGASAEINLGHASLETGDGLLLEGRILYVLQNGLVPGVPNQVTVVQLSPDLTSGQVERTITDPAFETATTLIRHGSRLAAVNAQFGGTPVDPEPEVVIFSAR